MAQDPQVPNVPKKLPMPSRTAEFPAGLISDYIRLVDQIAPRTRKA